MATDNPADSSPESERSDEERSRAWDLTNEIENKLVQAKGICDAMMHLEDVDGMIVNSLWAASDLIEYAIKAVDELYRELRSTEARAPKEVQS